LNKKAAMSHGWMKNFQNLKQRKRLRLQWLFWQTLNDVMARTGTKAEYLKLMSLQQDPSK
jgi:hypothetical protein